MVPPSSFRCLALSALLVAWSTAACASPGSGTPEETRVRISNSMGLAGDVTLERDNADVAARIDRDPAAVWQALMAVYAELGLEPDGFDAGRRFLGVQRFSGSRMAGQNTAPYLLCGTQGSGASAVNQMRIVLSVSSRVEAGPDGTSLLRSDVTGSATPVSGASRASSGCTTSGRLELRIARMVRDRLSPPPPSSPR